MAKQSDKKMSFYFILLISLLLGLLVGRANADSGKSGDVKTSFLFNCNLSFTASGRSAYLILGATHLKGHGMLSCYDFLNGQTEHIPLEVEIKGPGFGLGVTGFNVTGVGTGIGLNESPEALLGRYAMVRGSLAVGVGAGVGATLRISKGSIQLGLQVNGVSGLGAGVDALVVNISRSKTLTSQLVKDPLPEQVERYVIPRADEKVVTVRFDQEVRLVDDKGQEVKRLQFKRR